MTGFVDDLGFFARPSRMVDHDRSCDVARVTHVAVAWLRRRAERFVRRFTGVILYVVAADCTPTKARYIVTGEVAGEQFTRYGKRGIECMVARAWVYGVHSRDHVSVYPIIRPPRKVASTDHWTYFANIKDLFPLIRSLRPRGFAIHATCLDGAGFYATARVMEQYANAHAEANFAEGGARATVDLENLFVAILCVAHCCNGAVRWMMREYIPKEKELARGFMKSLHRAVGSLIDGFDLLVTHAPTLLEMIVWEPDDGTSSLDERRELWHALGFPEFFVDLIVQLNPRLRGDVLVCDADCRAWEPGKMLDIWLYIWKFRGFNEARFGSVGICLRALVSSLLVGTEPFVHKIINSGAHCYHLTQFNRLTHDHKVMAVTLCLACRVPEKLILAVLKDDRIIGRVDEFATHLSDEHIRLENFR
jgi:hypothetical protein